MVDTGQTPSGRAMPLRIVGLIVSLAAIEPALHYWILFYPPPGAVPTGAHTGDSAHHILCMRAIHSGFHSPFAFDSPNSIQNFCVPFFLLYAALGELGRLLHLDDFLFLGWVNAVGGVVLLAGAYTFLRTASPRHANRAFLIYSLGGGIGGAAYLFAHVNGWTQQAGFEQTFLKLAIYDLIEGQTLSPVLLMPRFYYSFPLGICFFSLAALIRATEPHSAPYEASSEIIPSAASARQTGNSGKKTLPVILVACGGVLAASFINPRLGPMVFLVAVVLAACARGLKRPLFFGFAALTGAAFGFGVMALHPVYLENVGQVTQSNMWPIAFLAATFWCWTAAPLGVRMAIQSLPTSLRFAAYSVLGYLAAYVLLYIGYHAYYGTWLRGGEVSAAVAVSDWALTGLLLGPLVTARRIGRPHDSPPCVSGATSRLRVEADSPGPPGWIALWLLLFLALSISAAGHGWFLRFSPQRFMVFMGAPLALLTAWGIECYRSGVRKLLLALILCSGALSLLVGALWFQGPCGRSPGKGPFAYLHYEYMPEQDAALLESLSGAVVIAPPWNPISFAEILSLRPALRVAGGAGAMNIGDQPFVSLQQDVSLLFSGKAASEQIREVLRRWRPDYIFLPSICSLSHEQIEPLLAFTTGGESWQPGDAALLTVRDEAIAR